VIAEPDGEQLRRQRRERPRIDGVLVVSKPSGPTSHDVVALVRRLTGVRRVGHGGTLDPFAMGVLPVFLGHATRMVEYHLSDEKGYRATVVFGARSSTDDIDGEMTPGTGPAPDREALTAALGAFRGPIEQVPPDHSAVHVGGRRAYEVAREGEKPELSPRTVTIHALDLVDWDAADETRPVAVLDIRCSAGTYVRALARDLGERLGCGAYLGALTRTASGAFTLEQAHPLDEVRAELAAGRIQPLLLPPDAGLDLPRVELGGDDLAALTRGQVVRMRGGLPRGLAEGVVRVVDPAGRLAAVAQLRAGRLHPDKVFALVET
jgi:tRNA pseudouridine55 synthase